MTTNEIEAITAENKHLREKVAWMEAMMASQQPTIARVQAACAAELRATEELNRARREICHVRMLQYAFRRGWHCFDSEIKEEDSISGLPGGFEYTPFSNLDFMDEGNRFDEMLNRENQSNSETQKETSQ